MSSNKAVNFANHPSLGHPSAIATSTSAPQAPRDINPVPPEAEQLVGLAVDGLVHSAREQDANLRFAGAQLAALRAAAAIVAVRSRTSSDPRGMAKGRALNVWQLLSRVAPELSEWAALFHYSAEKRIAVSAGTTAVSPREADDTLRDAAKFVAAVAKRLGIPNRRLDLTTQWLAVT